MAKVALKPTHYAVYVLDEATDRYGDPKADHLDVHTASIVAAALAKTLFPDGCHWDGLGFTRDGRPGSPSRNILIWDQSWRRD